MVVRRRLGGGWEEKEKGEASSPLSIQCLISSLCLMIQLLQYHFFLQKAVHFCCVIGEVGNRWEQLPDFYLSVVNTLNLALPLDLCSNCSTTQNTFLSG